MKISSGILGLALSFAMVHGGLAAKAPSKLSAFAGKYTGTVSYAGVVPGTTTGTFTASKKKDVGALNLTSAINVSGTIYTLVETFRINKRTLNYTFSILSTGATGAGSAAVGKKSISYSASAVIEGDAYTISGTISMSGKRGLVISEILNGSTSFPITYTLTRKGK
jgi:hypothetical protein